MPLSDLSDPIVLLRENWLSSQRHSTDGTPLLPPSFVAEAGPRIWIVDVRADAELTGPVGHIPGVWRMPLARIGQVGERLPAHTPVLLICDDGVRSATAARYLRALGMTTVAAMEGGMINWKSEGFSVSRDPAVLGRELEAPAPGHGSDGKLLSLDRKGRLTREQVVEHVGDSAKVRRVKLAAFLLARGTSCVDGREGRAIIGTPGGDAGELLLALASVERVAGAPVDTAQIPALTRAFADTFGGLYMHTDNHALNTLTRALHADARLEASVAGIRTFAAWEAFLRRPPVHLRGALLDHLVQPDHVGCGHLALALKNPRTYRIRPEIVTAFLRTFYRSVWEGAPDLSWVVLGGGHAEGAVVNVTLEGELSPFSEIPMIAPSIGGVQMFVNHPQVVAYLREQVARFLVQRVGSLLPIHDGHADALRTTIPELGAGQARATLEALAAGLPVFDVHFASGGHFAVTEQEPIPA